MKVNIIKSFRLKIAIYTLISLVGTIIIDAIVLLLLYIYNFQNSQFAPRALLNATQEIPAGIIKQPMPFAHNINMNMPGLTDNLLLDMFILCVFSALVFILIFIMASHNMVNYLREISDGIDRIKEGDFDTNIRIMNEDELSVMAYSLNDMRMQIKNLMEKERVAEKTKNDLITNVAHDLRTPLTSIIGYLDLIRSEKGIDIPIQMKYVNIAYDKSKHLQGLIEDLFDYTRYAKDKLDADKCLLDINRFMEQLVEEFYPSFEEHSLECQCNILKDEIMIDADGDLLARAISNLLSNAIKYGSDGKLIIIETKVRELEVSIAITNFGRIIPKYDLDKIFDKFYRVEGSRSLDTGGTGLGLAIAKNIIQMHDGHIGAVSNEKGTVFEVILPLVGKE